MIENSRVRNLAILLMLTAVFALPAFFIPADRMLDLVSGLMLIFGVAGLSVIAGEAWWAFWDGRRDRSALALYGLAALFLSVIVMRSYGIYTRNRPDMETAWLTESYTYAVLVYAQFVGLWLFTRASNPPSVTRSPSRWGQLVAGIIIGALLMSSKAIEPVLLFVSKLFSRLF